jgi:2'-5' RNA ligase
VTILFLGSVNEERFNQVKDGVNKVVKNFPVFELEAQKVRVQKNRFQNMLWLDFKPSLSFAELVSEISKQLNFSSGKKPLPHVNLVRTKEKIMAVNLPYEFKPTIKLHVDSIELWESHLSPKGTTYSSLGSFPLKK